MLTSNIIRPYILVFDLTSKWSLLSSIVNCRLKSDYNKCNQKNTKWFKTPTNANIYSVVKSPHKSAQMQKQLQFCIKLLGHGSVINAIDLHVRCETNAIESLYVNWNCGQCFLVWFSFLWTAIIYSSLLNGGKIQCKWFEKIFAWINNAKTIAFMK